MNGNVRTLQTPLHDTVLRLWGSYQPPCLREARVYRPESTVKSPSPATRFVQQGHTGSRMQHGMLMPRACLQYNCIGGMHVDARSTVGWR
jgi:hypothetical protein